MLFVFKNADHYESHRKWLFQKFEKNYPNVQKIFFLKSRPLLPNFLQYLISSLSFPFYLIYFYLFKDQRVFVFNTIGPCLFGSWVSIILPNVKVGIFLSGLGSVLSGSTFIDLGLKKSLIFSCKRLHKKRRLVFFVQNEFDAREILTWNGSKPFVVKQLPGVGLLLKFGAFDEMRSARVPSRAFRITWVGRLTEDKGVKKYLEIVRRLRELEHNLRPLEFSLYGRPSPSSVACLSIDYVKRSCANLNIEFIKGSASGFEKFLDKDLLLFLSKREGMPVTVCEAMSSGCTVLGLRVPGTIDALDFGRNGIVADPKYNATELADLVASNIDSELVSFRKNAFQWVKTNFSRDINTKTQFELIQTAFEELEG